MKREATAIIYPDIGSQLGLFVKNGKSAIQPFFGKIKKNLSAFVVNVQISRMISVLHSMSDRQLEEIGITRAEISEYAKSLVKEEEYQS